MNKTKAIAKGMKTRGRERDASKVPPYDYFSSFLTRTKAGLTIRYRPPNATIIPIPNPRKVKTGLVLKTPSNQTPPTMKINKLAATYHPKPRRRIATKTRPVFIGESFLTFCHGTISREQEYRQDKKSKFNVIKSVVSCGKCWL